MATQFFFIMQKKKTFTMDKKKIPFYQADRQRERIKEEEKIVYKGTKYIINQKFKNFFNTYNIIERNITVIF